MAKVYYDPSQPEGYAGAARLKKKFPKANVTKWLATQPAYTAQANETKIYNSDVQNIWSKRFMADGFDGDDSLRTN